MAVLRNMVIAVAVIVLFWLTTPDVAGDKRIVLVVFAALAGGACALSARFPAAGAVLAVASTAVGWCAGVTTDPLLLAAPGVYLVAERRGVRPVSRWSIGAVAVLGCAVMLVDGSGAGRILRDALLGALTIAAAWALGVRGRQSVARAADDARRDARARMSRDVHDVLSHALGTIGVRAGVAAHVDAGDAQRLRGALDDISVESRKALAELSAVLSDDPEAAAVLAGGLRNELEEIVARAAAAGVVVRLEMDERCEDLPAATATVVYRVVQEGVTNVTRHSSARRARVVIASEDGRVVVSVSDGGGAEGLLREGNGLRGMRSRIAEVGGTLDVAAESDGVTLTARLPGSTARA